ncbi:MAG: hypothetical protein NTZ32_03240 [Planctomycetales bacterium]|nr:hypothetical protein [Planctomycetales bacterium]
MKTTAKSVQRIEGLESLADGIYEGRWENNVVRFAISTSKFEATTIPVVRGPSLQVKVLVEAGVVTVLTLDPTGSKKVGTL